MSGNFKGDAREPFKGNIKWVGLYNPAAETGVLYMLEPPLDKAVHFFWDRAYDRKLYFRGRLGDIKISKKNNRFEYLVKIVGFESQAVDWKEKASSIAGFSQGG